MDWPGRHQKLTDNQLSALFRFSERQHNLLAFGMAVWAPYGQRRDRNFVFSAHHRNAAGEWVTKEVPGPPTLHYPAPS